VTIKAFLQGCLPLLQARLEVPAPTLRGQLLSLPSVGSGSTSTSGCINRHIGYNYDHDNQSRVQHPEPFVLMNGTMVQSRKVSAETSSFVTILNDQDIKRTLSVFTDDF